MTIRKYLYFIKIGLREGLQYRANTFSGIGATIISLTLYYFIWKAIAASGELSQPFAVIISYVALAQVISNSTSANLENTITQKVRKGTIVNELKRPMSLKLQLYFNQLGKSIFRLFVRGIPSLIIGIIFLNVGLPSLLNIIYFILSIFLSLNLAIMLSYTTSLLVFWTKVGWSLRMTRTMIAGLFSGAMIPLYLVPENIRRIFHLTPFPSMVDAPISIYQGTAQNISQIFGTQIIWIILLITISELLWRKAKQKITVQGG